MSTQDFIKLAQTLPPMLTRFFARFPPGTANDVVRNPFKPTIHPLTKKWHNPVYSLRRQKKLVVLAREYGVDSLLPPTVKAEKKGPTSMKKMMKPKGKLWERTLKERLEIREKAMREMPALIEKWRKLGHGRGWTKWPR